MEDRPEHLPGLARRDMDGIELVMAGDDGDADDELPPARQPEQHRHRQHAQADGPDHLQVKHLRREGESPRKVDHAQLENDQEQAALEQVAADRRARVGELLAVAPGADPGQKDEDRRAPVAGQAGEEQRRIDAGEVHRIADLAVQVEELADVIDQHQGHHHTAQGIDGVDALSRQADQDQNRVCMPRVIVRGVPGVTQETSYELA